MAVEDSIDNVRPSNDAAAAHDSSNLSASSRPCIILFYKYHPLSDDLSVVELYRLALERFCGSLGLRGRILVGCSEHRSEGINGTLSGTKQNLEKFVKAFAVKDGSDPNAKSVAVSSTPSEDALQTFRTDCEAFYRAANCPPLEMEESEFKWSELSRNSTDNTSNGANNDGIEVLFPDLNIKIVNELIGTGGVLSSIQLDELQKGYLTPQEWHERINQLQAQKQRASAGGEEEEEKGDTILIDCRNTKECSIGNFVGSIDPQTTTFNQFPKWVDDHKHKLRDKKVLMYCTGGIRCEKASAYVRQAMGSSVKEVRHLQGGIHKYLEAFGGGGGNETDGASTEAIAETASLWRGKNFVFDGRGAHGPAGGSSGSSARERSASASASPTAVGACRYCEAPYDSFDPHCVCTVCKEPILVCQTCQTTGPQQRASTSANANAPPPQDGNEESASSHETQHLPQHYREYHCATHRHLEGCYFSNLDGFSREELVKQLVELEHFAKEIAVGKKFRQRRKTLAKQRAKIETRLEAMQTANEVVGNDNNGNNGRSGIEWKCRNCGQIGCSGKCWGFHGLKRKRVLEQKVGEEQQQRHGKDGRNKINTAPSTKACAKNKQNERLKQQKELQKQKQIDEWIASGLTLGPTAGRDPSTGMRVPKPCVRVLETTTKGKWCGQPLLRVLQTEFPNSFSSRSISSESEAENTLRILLRKGLIRVNGHPIHSLDEANNYKLKNMDVIDRIVLWHEPPVHLPSETIRVQKIPIPDECLSASKAKYKTSGDVSDNHIYVCNKPSTLPVHPAGPYLSNSLTMLVEAQEGLRPKTLIPCHRIDRVTSGMTICCADSRVARLIQTAMAAKANGSSGSRISKQYLARVMGRFPSNETNEGIAAFPSANSGALARWAWIANDPKKMMADEEIDSNLSAMLVQVDAPIETVDPLNGVRKITPEGKASTSLFRLLEYDAHTDTSIIACVPVTGRSHQLRVHLQWLGHSIVNDAQYGGAASSGMQIDPSAGLQRMIDNVREFNSHAVEYTSAEASTVGSGSSLTITEEQVKAARDVCPTCDLDTEGRGPSSAFSPAQLLQGGHAIELHAYRYSLEFPFENKQGPTRTKESGKNETDGGQASVFRTHLRVDLPPWALHLRKRSTQSLSIPFES